MGGKLSVGVTLNTIQTPWMPLTCSAKRAAVQQLYTRPRSLRQEVWVRSVTVCHTRSIEEGKRMVTLEVAIGSPSL